MKGESFLITKDDKLKAVYADDLAQFLLKLGIWDNFAEGNCKCRYCEETITRDNLYAFIPIDNAISFCCKSPSCIVSMNKEAKK